MDFGVMPSGSRSLELVDWLRCGLGFVFLAAALWWQELQQAGAQVPEISNNKVGSWSSSARVVLHATDPSTSVIFTKLPWRKSDEEAASSSSTSNKCVSPSVRVGAVRSPLLPNQCGGGERTGGSICV